MNFDLEKLHSIWLVPEEQDEIALRSLIDELADKYHAPHFIPHLTLFSRIDMETETLKKIITETFEDQKSFIVKKDSIEQSDDFFKTVFINIELDDNLKNLFNKLSNRTGKRDLSLFKPHISLIYKNLEEKERIDMARTIKIKNELKLNRIFVVAPKRNDNNFKDMENLRVLFIKNLRN